MAKDHAKEASRLFRSGMNCAQAVISAFNDETGLDPLEVEKLTSSFGGGMGRMREICGAVSSLLMLAGHFRGYTSLDPQNKKAHYARVQALMRGFEKEFGSYSCRELLGVAGAESPEPAVRDEAYYNSRPCEKCIMYCARIAEKEFLEGEQSK